MQRAWHSLEADSIFEMLFAVVIVNEQKEEQERRLSCFLSNLCLGGKEVPSGKEMCFTGNSERR